MQGTDGKKGRVLALDLGDRRIGVALSDESRMLARGLDVFERTSRQADFEYIGRLVDEHDVSLIIVGLPTLPSGEEGSRAVWARDYAADLDRAVPADVCMWDESFSTQDAQASLRARGKSRRQRKRRLDAVAAAFILQSFLDSSAGPADA
ncbi:MAG: Holliday junction resolvase RuvX [Candidatus Promineifilaceae bacterium]|nr:Holliday junction resolvase RuvX [Candidatus Promineifilaceae bacterium]